MNARGSWPPRVPGRTQDEPKGEPLLYFPKALGGWLRLTIPFWKIEKMETQKGHMTHLKEQLKTQLEPESRFSGSSPHGLCPNRFYSQFPMD